jgi:hypothetical protein
LHSFYATQINAAPNLLRAALNNLFLIYYSSIKLSSPSEDELPPEVEPPLEDEPESDVEPPPLGVLLPESAEELPEVEGAEDF